MHSTMMMVSDSDPFFMLFTCGVMFIVGALVIFVVLRLKTGKVDKTVWLTSLSFLAAGLIAILLAFIFQIKII